MPYLGISWLKFLKTIVIFEIGTFKFIKNEFLAHAVNFCIGPDFTFGPGSVFLKVRVLVQVWFIKYVQFGGIKPLFSSIYKTYYLKNELECGRTAPSCFVLFSSCKSWCDSSHQQNY